MSYDPSLASGCTLCRRSSEPAAYRINWMLPTLLVIAIVGGAAYYHFVVEGARVPELAPAPGPAASAANAVTAGVPQELRYERLSTKNEAGRSGVYYVPASGAAGMPVLVLLHGTGQNATAIAGAFRELADRRGFAMLAPESRRSPDGQLTWQVGDTAGAITPDLTHVVACLAELRKLKGAALGSNVLIAGFSGGASSAPYIATNADGFSAYASLHGGVFADGLGPRALRGWFSTGADDAVRSPERVKEAANSVSEKKLPLPEYRVYPGGHEIRDAEAVALIAWWLGN